LRHRPLRSHHPQPHGIPRRSPELRLPHPHARRRAVPQNPHLLLNRRPETPQQPSSPRRPPPPHQYQINSGREQLLVLSTPITKTVISTEAAHGLIVSSGVEKSASLPPAYLPPRRSWLLPLHPKLKPPQSPGKSSSDRPHKSPAPPPGSPAETTTPTPSATPPQPAPSPAKDK